MQNCYLKCHCYYAAKNKANSKEAPAKEEDDPYAGFGTEEIAAPLQTDDLAYDEGFQVSTSMSRSNQGAEQPSNLGRACIKETSDRPLVF